MQIEKPTMPLIRSEGILSQNNRPTTAVIKGNTEIKNALLYKEKNQKPKIANVYFNDYIDMQYRVMNKNTERYLNAFGKKEGAKVYNKNTEVNNMDSNYDYDGTQYALTMGNERNEMVIIILFKK